MVALRWKEALSAGQVRLLGNSLFTRAAACLGKCRAWLSPGRMALFAGIDFARIKAFVAKLSACFKAAFPIQAITKKATTGTARSREHLTQIATLTGRIATAGLNSPTTRFSTRITAKLAAAAFGITFMAGFVPFVVDVAGQSEPVQNAELAQSSPVIGTAVIVAKRPEVAAGVETPAPKRAMSEPSATGSMASWTRNVKPIAIFGVSLPELGALPQRYESLRNTSGGRDDRLTFGSFAAAKSDQLAQSTGANPALGPHLYVSFLRMPVSADGQGSQSAVQQPRAFFIDLVRQSADLGLAVERTQQPTLVTTKFGAFEVADAAMTQGDHHRACLAFRFVDEKQSLRMTGWWCGAGGKPADRRQLACMLDRVDLLSAGEDKDLRALFIAAEKSRDQGCSSQRMATVGRKTSWLDSDVQAPLLRGPNTSKNLKLRTES